MDYTGSKLGKPGKKEKRLRPGRLSPKDFEELCREIFEERGPWCEDCKSGVVWGQVEYDHLKTKGSGGGDTKENLRQRCHDCHDGRHKANKPEHWKLTERGV